MIKINGAPIKVPFISDGQADKSWVQHFSELTDSLKGDWGTTKILSVYSYASEADVSENRYTCQGPLVHVHVQWSPSADIVYQVWNLPYPVLDGVLDLIQLNGSTIASITPVVVEDSKVHIPGASSGYKTILSGILRRK